MSTDRVKIKDQQEGTYLTSASMSDARAAVKDVHRRTHQIVKTGTENAATNVAQTIAVGYVHRKYRLRGVGIAAASNIAGNATNYDVFKFYKTVAGVSTLIGSWNTHTSAQSTITLGTPALVTVGAGLITNSDAEIVAGASVDYIITKVAAGMLVDPGMVFSFDFEEI